MTKYYTIKDIAEEFGVHRLTVSRYMDKLGIEAPKSRFDRREVAVSQAQKDLLDQAMNGGPEPLIEDATAKDITR